MSCTLFKTRRKKLENNAPKSEEERETLKTILSLRTTTVEEDEEVPMNLARDQHRSELFATAKAKIAKLNETDPGKTVRRETYFMNQWKEISWPH